MFIIDVYKRIAVCFVDFSKFVRSDYGTGKIPDSHVTGPERWTCGRLDWCLVRLCAGNGSYGQYGAMGASMSAYAHQAPQYPCEPNWAAVRYAGELNYFLQLLPL